MMPTYRLDQEPWIPVERLDGTYDECSLTEVFQCAKTIRRLAGNPVESAVLHRLLLAILHRAVKDINNTQWQQLWQTRSDAMSKALKYLEAQCGSFDLYDPERPFLQHPSLEPGNKPVAVLLYDRAQGNNSVFLDASHEADAYPAASAMIARGLLVNLAFGGSHPDKTNPLSTGKETTMYAGPLCARLVAVLEGCDLERTLVLNLLSNVTVGLPAWERPIAPHPGKADPDGISDRYTRMTRFIRLKPSQDGTQCVSVALHMGEQLAEDDERPQDPMIPLYLAPDKRLKVQRIEPGRALWRTSHVFLNAREKADAIPIKALEQAVLNRALGALDEAEPVSLRILGIAGNAHGTKTDLWRDETLPFSLSLVADDRQFTDLLAAVESANRVAKTLGSRLFGFAMRYLQGGAPNVKREDAESLVDEIAPGLSNYWSMIAPMGERLGCGDIDGATWQATLNQAADEAFKQAVQAIPPSARRLCAQFALSHSNSLSNKVRQGELA